MEALIGFAPFWDNPPPEMKRLKLLEKENGKLKKLVADRPCID
jgi:hypothetical protein